MCIGEKVPEKLRDILTRYSSSGWWNDIVQGPINVMSNPISRKKEMRWMRDLGVLGCRDACLASGESSGDCRDEHELVHGLLLVLLVITIG